MRCPLPRDTFLNAIPASRVPVANPASIPARSPLRYPGGKTWLIPHVRQWLAETASSTLVEPFAGGAGVSLTAVMENLVKNCIMIEIDRDVAAFWHSALGNGAVLRHIVYWFDLTPERLSAVAESSPKTLTEHGFRTLVLNRTRYGGNLARRASFMRNGENGNGLASRWYPKTLSKRLANIEAHSDRIVFMEGNAMEILPDLLRELGRDAAVFLDPPYVCGGKRAGHRLYNHSEIDHATLFALLDETGCNFLMTLEASPEAVELVTDHGFAAVRVKMKTGHHESAQELVITPSPLFEAGLGGTAASTREDRCRFEHS